MSIREDERTPEQKKRIQLLLQPRIGLCRDGVSVQMACQSVLGHVNQKTQTRFLIGYQNDLK